VVLEGGRFSVTFRNASSKYQSMEISSNLTSKTQYFQRQSLAFDPIAKLMAVSESPGNLTSNESSFVDVASLFISERPLIYRNENVKSRKEGSRREFQPETKASEKRLTETSTSVARMRNVLKPR